MPTLSRLTAFIPLPLPPSLPVPLPLRRRAADEAGAIADAQEQAEKRLKAIDQLDPDLDADDDAGNESSDDESSDDDDDEAELLRE